MGAIVDLMEARERRAERFIRSAGELRREMGRLCGDLEAAVGRLGEAREAVDRARIRIEASRSRMERIQDALGLEEPRSGRRHLRLISG